MEIPGVTSIDNTIKPKVERNGGGELGKDDFLKLLIAQLSAQDPLDPMGAQDFSAQLAQFSGLEQMTNVNANLEIIQKLETASQNNSALNLIGKTVESYGNAFSHSENASETLSYSLDSDATSIRIDIFDNSNSQVDLVRLGGQTQGKNNASWDGFDKNGNPLPAGTYTYTVKAENYNGDTIGVDTFTSGLVSDVVFGDGEAHAIVNGKELPISSIKRVTIKQ